MFLVRHEKCLGKKLYSFLGNNLVGIRENQYIVIEKSKIFLFLKMFTFLQTFRAVSSDLIMLLLDQLRWKKRD